MEKNMRSFIRSQKQIPESWSLHPLGDLILSSQYGLSISADENGTYPILGMSDLANGRIKIKTSSSVNLSDEDFFKYCLKKDDILFNRTNSLDLVGKTGLVKSDMDAVFASYLIRFKTDNTKVLPRFLIHFLNLPSTKYELKSLATPGVSQSNINPTQLQKHLYILLPPIDEQKKITEILSIWDKNIVELENLISLKELRKNGLIQNLINSNCHVWEHERTDNIFQSISDKNHPEEVLLSVTQDRGVIPRTMLEGKVMSPEGDVSSYKMIKPGDYVVSLRSFQGGLEYSTFQGLISPAYTILRPKINIDNDYFRHFFKTTIFIKKYLASAVIGIRDGKQISFTDFSSVKLPLPSISQQKNIAQILNTSEEEITATRKLLGKYKQKKTGLMQKLLSGDLRV